MFINNFQTCLCAVIDRTRSVALEKDVGFFFNVFFFFMLFFTKICLFNGLTECSESSVEWTRLVSSLAA